MSLSCSLQKQIGEFSLDVKFQADEGEFLSILGPSGCGKTTILRLIAGLLKPDRGSILINSVDVTDEPAHKRGIGFVFQDYALFPQRDVYRNIAYGLERKHMSHLDIRNRVRELLDLVGLAGYEGRDVTTLSGGEQQRVALARALAPFPRLLLLDEPLSALDTFLRDNLRRSLRSIQKQLSLTTVYVTHDQAEALSISDRIVLVREGRVEQTGSPQELYRYPASLFAGKFLGDGNILRGKLEALGDDGFSRCRITSNDTQNGYETLIAHTTESLKGGETVCLFFRPEDGTIIQRTDGGENTLVCTVTEIEYLGRESRVWLETGGYRLMSYSVPGMEPKPGTQCTIHIAKENLIAFQG